MKEISNTTQFLLIIILAAIAFWFYRWSQNGRYTIFREGTRVVYLLDSRSGRIEVFMMTKDLEFEYFGTIKRPEAPPRDIFDDF